MTEFGCCSCISRNLKICVVNIRECGEFFKNNLANDDATIQPNYIFEIASWYGIEVFLSITKGDLRLNNKNSFIKNLEIMKSMFL